jgi:predicted  nucleic acid-binding Zn-ribbon protein
MTAKPTADEIKSIKSRLTKAEKRIRELEHDMAELKKEIMRKDFDEIATINQRVNKPPAV